jgi:hypothetical protein
MLARTQAANPLVNRSQFSCECLKPVELGHLFGSPAKRCRIGKRFRNAFTFDLAQETKLRMPLRIGLCTVARGLSTTARNRRYGAGAKVTQGKKLLHEFAA